MCGIIGQININNGEAAKLDLNKIGHRGPDSFGEWKNRTGNVYLGHTRLAILEPTLAGHQPMSNAQNTVVVTFNGEIYNHLELRKLLPGITWRGTSDTETLVELLSMKGIAALDLLQGMFSFALYDLKEKTILLVRDRLGIKPLYFKINDETVSFASEVKALLNQGENIEFNKKAISQYLGFGHFPATGEILNGVESIPPGGWCLVQENGTIERGYWWNMERKVSLRIKKDKKEVSLKVKEIVTKVIEEHLISDVGVASFLSGGVDSSIISTVAGKALGKRLKTFTVGFPKSKDDERKIAQKVATIIGSEHTEIVIDEFTCIEWIKQAVRSLDLPSVDAINTFIVSKAVKDAGIKVALSGLGGDELFGGYPSFKKVSQMHFLAHLPFLLTNGLGNKFSRKYREKYSGISSFSLNELAVNYRRFTSAGELNNMGFPDGTPLIPYFGDSEIMKRISINEIYGYTIPMLLRDSDQMSMSVGLEIRVPFLDHKLVKTVLNFPDKIKSGHRPKSLLIEAFKECLPSEVYSRPKQGFSLPMDLWMKSSLREFTAEGVEAAASALQLKQPLDLQKKYHHGSIHWTRLWLWAVLGHWLQNQQIEHLIPNTETAQ